MKVYGYHRISLERDSRKPVNIVVSKKDKEVLRELGREVARIGSLPIQQKRKSMWARLNGLEAVKPMVWFSDVCWNEMNVYDELVLKTSTPFCQRIESELRQTIYLWKHMPGDMVVDPIIYSPLSVHNTGVGLDIEEDIVKTDEDNVIVSHRYHTQIKDEEDIQKIKAPKITHDKTKSEEDFQAYKDIFEGILTVEKRGAPGFAFAPWDDIVRLIGAQEALLNLAMRAEFAHKVVDRITTVYINALEEYESQNLLALNNTNLRIGSGAYGYTDELPQAGYNEMHVRATDIWGSATAQIFSDVSPEMHEAFALNYERRWLERFGLTYYGCCEPLDEKMDILRKIPNLRKISVSPWNDIERMAEQITDDYVFSLKPNPAIFASDHWDPGLAREELLNTLKIALRYKCNVEVIMKDISTVRHQPQRLWEWTKIATEVSGQTDKLIT